MINKNIDINFDIFYQEQIFQTLPNPDPILRKLGRNQEVFAAMSYDPHISGELRSVKAGLLKDGWQVIAGGDNPHDIKAFELVKKVMDTKPNKLQQWDDLIWILSQATFYGYKVLEIKWDNVAGFMLPVCIIDRPNQCFAFDSEYNLRVMTPESPDGVLATEQKYLVAVNEPSSMNPYGKALFSSCFWAYTFKYNGFKYFAKFSEKYALPYVIGRYGETSTDEDKEDLLKAISEVLETNAFIISENDKVEFVEPSHKNPELHLNFIDLCNRELSKALTSQTLATEVQNTGSYSASSVHRERELSVNQLDRRMLEASMNEFFSWITKLNFPFAKEPKFVFNDRRVEVVKN